MLQLSHPYMATGKTIALTIRTFVSKVMSLLSNTLSMFVIAFLPRSKHLLTSWLQSPSAEILEPKKIESFSVISFCLFILFMGNQCRIHHPYGRKWRTKEPLDESGRGEWKSWLKTQHSSGPITSWQIDGETMESARDFIFGGSKITADGDCGHEVKRCLLLGIKTMTNLDNKWWSPYLWGQLIPKEM